MPPRRSARVAAVAERASSALSPLPLALVLHIFSLLPADERARAACVCRGWCHVLLELSLWTRLDLSFFGGVTREVTDVVLQAAAAKARGQLAALDVSDCARLSVDALLAVVRANAGALRELCVGTRLHAMPQTLNANCAAALLQAAPQLIACHAHVYGAVDVADARRMLRNEPPFQPLRLRELRVFSEIGADEASVLSLAADLADHVSLKRVYLEELSLQAPAALDAVVNAVLTSRLDGVCFWACRLSPASAPALARLLSGGTLTDLIISQRGQQLLDDASAALLGAALCTSTTLTSLSLLSSGLWNATNAAAVLLSALTGHPSLCMLAFVGNSVDATHATAAGASLGALIAANAPALERLSVSHCRLNDAALRPLFDALPANTHLRELDISHSNMTATFARDVLLPAVRANTSLRKLDAESDVAHPGVAEATALVAARGGGGGAV
jgi:hypothetical protein